MLRVGSFAWIVNRLGDCRGTRYSGSRIADAAGLDDARRPRVLGARAGHRLVDVLEDQSRAVLARCEGIFRDPQGIELTAEEFGLHDLSRVHGRADLPHQFHGLLPSGQRGTDGIGAGKTVIDLAGTGGVVLLPQGGDPPRKVVRLGVEGAIGHPLLAGQSGQLVGLLQLAPLQQGLGLLHEHPGVGLAILFRGAVQAV